MRLRRSKLHIPRFPLARKAPSFRCSSSSLRKRSAGLRRGWDGGCGQASFISLAFRLRGKLAHSAAPRRDKVRFRRDTPAGIPPAAPLSLLFLAVTSSIALAPPLARQSAFISLFRLSPKNLRIFGCFKNEGAIKLNPLGSLVPPLHRTNAPLVCPVIKTREREGEIRLRWGFRRDPINSMDFCVVSV